MGRLPAAMLLIVALLGVPAAGPAAAAPPEVTAEGAVLWDPLDDRVLWGKNEDRPLRPASTTKIMTVLLALEAGTIDDTVRVSTGASDVGRRPGAATLNLDPGETVPMRSLMQGLLLRSGNDAAVAVAEHVSGSEQAFVEEMNARAREIGMTDTNFINSTGLTDDLDHRTSALDLARLADVALRNDDFAAWAGAATLSVPSLGTLANRNELIGRYEGANGVKTGYTALAGLCLVSSAERKDRLLIAVVLNSDDSTTQGSFNDATRVLDHGFDDFRLARPLRSRQPAATYRWHNEKVPVLARQSLSRTLPASRGAQLRISLTPSADRPLEAGATMGVAELAVGERVVDRTDLVAAKAVPAPATGDAAPVAAGAAVEETMRAFAHLFGREEDA